MNKNMFKILSSYTSWILSNYQAIAKINSSTPLLRLVSKELDKKTGDIRFKIQIAGKNIFPVLSPQDLLNSEALDNFSKNDQDIIYEYLSNKKQGAFKRITARTYDTKSKKFLYTIEFFDMETNTFRCITLNHLTPLLNDVENFDIDDAKLIRLASKEE